MREETVRFSLVVPTIGRPELERCLVSAIKSGLKKDVDQLIVVTDGPQHTAQKIVYSLRHSVNSICIPSDPNHMYGHPQRNIGVKLATGTHIISIDDDDEYIGGAITYMRRKIEQSPDRVHLFRFNQSQGRGALWVERDVICGNVGTPMIAVPNVPEKLSQFGYRYEGDFDFISETIERFGGEGNIVWDDAILVQAH